MKRQLTSPTPSTDLAVWLEAIFERWPIAEIRLHSESVEFYPESTTGPCFYVAGDIRDAFRQALAQALEAEGVVLEGTE